MPRLASRNRVALVAGLATLLLIDAAVLLLPETWLEIVRENAFDIVLGGAQYLSRPARHQTGVNAIVVDIDRRSLEQIGPWPWPRERMAELAEAIAKTKPAVVAFDILFTEPDDRSPAALARRLAGLTGRTDVAELAKTLPDGDALLAKAFKVSPVVLGFVLDPEQAGSVPAPPVLIRGSLPFVSLWRGAGAIGPPPSLGGSIEGLGTLSLPADADGVIRRVPLFVGAGESLLPGFALETVRIKRRIPDYALQSRPPLLTLGEARLFLPGDGLLRLLPVGQDGHAARTIAAVDVLGGTSDVSRLAGTAVVVGGSAPELGGLRKTPTDPLTPDTQIQADAIEQILAGRVPREFAHAAIVGLSTINILGLVMLVAGAELSPFAGALILGVVLALFWGATASLAAFADRLVDPLTPSLASIGVFAVASTWSYAVTHRREALVRRRFEQHLAPAVVRRIVDEPDLVKLSGERRQITALFTDIESFTSMTHRAGPEQLVAVLDQYFEGCAAIIIEHGGMIDKIVGDAVHALFNAPVDLPDHPRRAVACATAIRQWSAAFRQTAFPASLGFGRTRIGIETGDAIVGDVGIRAKLDYTAHGDAVNAAARLEAANKDLGSTICIGPMAASFCDAAALRPLGTITLRGRDESHAVFEPWPESAPDIWREKYLAAFDLVRQDPAQAAERFAELAAELPGDPVSKQFAERLRRRSQQAPADG
jgi:adenylate cyclase